jgi:hypothetical protein
MPKFGPFDRAAGAQLAKVGNGFGAFVAVARLDGEAGPTAWNDRISGFLQLDGVVGARVFEVAHDTTDIMSEEKTMRAGPEGDFRYLLCVEAMSDEAVITAARMIGKVPGVTVRDISVRRMICGEAPHEGPADK